MNIFISALLALPLLLFQTYTIIMAPSSVEVDPMLAADVEEYLGENLPEPTTLIYAITGVTYGEGGTYISLVGLDPDLPDPYTWSFEDDEIVIWSGALVQTEGVISEYDTGYTAEAGGSADVSFPWAIGTKMMFGTRGIHGAQLNSVDWVSGDDMGSNASGPEVYASAPGTILTVCEDAVQMGVVIDGDMRFAYLHLEKNSNLTVGREVVRGEYLGSLKYGTFTGVCGYAEQQSNHYHLHWSFEPQSGHFQAESWILNYTTVEWKRGNETVKVGQWMTGGGGSGDTDPDDPNTPVEIPRFWTYILTGVRAVYDTVISRFPLSAASLESDQIFELATNAVAEVITMANILLVNDIINLSPIIWLFIAIILYRVVMFFVGLILIALVIVKRLPGL